MFLRKVKIKRKYKKLFIVILKLVFNLNIDTPLNVLVPIYCMKQTLSILNLIKNLSAFGIHKFPC